MQGIQPRFCQYCGQEITGKENFCPKCGNPTVTGQATFVSSAEMKKKKKPPMIVRIVIAFAAVVVVIAILLPSPKKSDVSNATDRSSQALTEIPATAEIEPTPRPFPVQTNFVDNWEISVTDFEFVDKISSSWLTSYSPNENSKYALVHLSIKNHGTERDSFAPILGLSDYYLTCKIVSGIYTYESAALLGYSDDLTHKVLNPLESASGILAFAFPEDYADSTSQLLFICSKNGISQTFYLR